MSATEISPRSVVACAAGASIITKFSLHPIDTVKTRLQTTPLRDGSTYWGSFAEHWQGRWGVRSVFKGVSLKLVAYAPSQSVYITTYTVMNDRLQNLNVPPSASIVLSTAMASLLAGAIRVPVEVMKTRLQSCVYQSVPEALRGLRKDGIRALSKLFIPQVFVHDLPFGVAQWLCYENLRPRVKSALDCAEKNSEGNSAFVAGGVAGGFAGLVTTPLDVIKSATIVGSQGGYVAPWTVAQELYRLQGFKAFARGMNTRCIWMASNTSVYLYVFETMKSYCGAYVSASSFAHLRSTPSIELDITLSDRS